MSDKIRTTGYPSATAVRGTGNNRRGGVCSLCNVPNTLCVVRLIGSIVLVFLALNGNSNVFLGCFLLLILTDWIDGKLAKLLNQRTDFGARLDSVADATLYAALLFGICWLKPDFVFDQAIWIAAVVISYLATSVAGLIKFRRVPSYHTWAAKSSDHLMTIAVICLFTGWADWPAQLAMAVVVFTNLEATAITIAMQRWRANVPSFVHAIRQSQPSS